jgi:hypothetical protein
MHMHSAFLLVLTLVLFAARAAAQEIPPPMPLQQQEALEQMNKFRGMLDDLKRMTIKEAAAKKAQCMKAFGDPAFCECIGEQSPVGVSFIGYVSIVAGTKEEFKYDQMSEDDKKLFDATRAARDKCVSWKGKAEALSPASRER